MAEVNRYARVFRYFEPLIKIHVMHFIILFGKPYTSSPFYLLLKKFPLNFLLNPTLQTLLARAISVISK